MSILKKLSEQFSLTRTEIKIILVLILTLLSGSLYKTFFKTQQTDITKKFNYSVQDSLFNAAGIEQSPSEKSSNEVDYKAEVLDFNKRSSETKIKKVVPAEKSININTAGITLLSNLPGIGVKTAQNIISFREKAGKINRIEQLLEVKGIGKSKLNNISKYLFIE